jgi:thiol:disulfide interchange protein DsbD
MREAVSSRAARLLTSRAANGRGLLALAAAVAWLLVAAAGAQTATGEAPRKPSTPRVRVELISEREGIVPGASFWVGVRQRIAPGWHTYWINPGDSGEPMTIEWALPPGFEAEDLVWPHPERLPVGPAMTFGYSREVVLLARITAPDALEPGDTVTLAGRAAWLVCEKICIPEEGDVRLALPVVAGDPPPSPLGARAIARARRAVPAPSPWPASFSVTAEAIALEVEAAGLAADRIADVYFYPGQWGVVDHAAPQQVAIGERGITVRAARGALTASAEAPIEGVLVVKERLDDGVASQAFALRATRQGAPPAAPAPAPGLSLLQVVALALAGGLVLNLMPCVLPVLSVKALAMVRHAGHDRATLARHGVAYTAGVLASFGVVAGALVSLRAGGAQIGWGFQLQSPVFVTLLAYLFFALALGLSGAIVIGGRITGAGHALAARPGCAGSFFTGALATVAATPCTAPFMGVAVGFAVTAAPATALLVFEALGLGLALPYLLLSLVPAWCRLLPRPGPWMIRLEQLLAFPLYATVAWLTWVVSRQSGPEGVAAVAAGLVLIAFAAWLFQATRTSSGWGRRMATAAAGIAALAAIALGPLIAAGPPAPGSRSASAPGAIAWEPFSASRVAELRAEGKPVFVNFTAAWCVTCLVNERVALGSPAVADTFRAKGVACLKADWTNRDPEIARVLGSFGRSGVPLYVVYPPARPGEPGGGEPSILPQILSEGTIIDAIEKM